VSKNGFSALETGDPRNVAPDGEAVSYMAVGAFSGAQSGSFPDGYVSRRSANGWETTNVSPPTPDVTPPGGDPVTYDFSEDLSQMVTKLPLQQLAEGATPEVSNLFMAATAATRVYSWINNVKPQILLPEGCPRPEDLALCWQLVDKVAFAGASTDFRHVLFEAKEKLVEGAPEEVENLYESAYEAGRWHVSLVGILPDKTAAPGGATAGSGSSINYFSVQPEVDKRVANAISEDGVRVVFQAAADGGEPDPAQAGQIEVYDRLNGSETIELSAPSAGAKPKLTTAEPAMFWAASVGGTRVFFTSAAELTTPSYTGASEPKGRDLYEYNLEAKTLQDLTVDANLPADEEEGAAVQGVVGASADGSYVYFVAKGQLVPGRGVDHADNLYVVHNGGAPVYIATLNESDSGDWTETAADLDAYVTPDGTHVAFTSVNSPPTVNFPSGYDNVNAATSNAEPEVYEYSAPTATEEGEGLTGSVVCASCDPSGARPIGSGLLGGINRNEPGTEGRSVNTPFRQARAVSDNGGRVFFSSPDPLVNAVELNGNTQAKVYEYERAGEGSCRKPAGCIYLLSSPSSSQAAAFMGADSEGNNVFVATLSQLTPSDKDTLVDVYDARVYGGLMSPPTETACGQRSCLGSAGETLATPAPLSAFTGASGNLAPPSSKGKPAATKAQKLAKALNQCHKKRSKRQRRSCEAKARKRYGSANAKTHRNRSKGRK
jgi:hypothetical protein